MDFQKFNFWMLNPQSSLTSLTFYYCDLERNWLWRPLHSLRRLTADLWIVVDWMNFWKLQCLVWAVAMLKGLCLRWSNSQQQDYILFHRRKLWGNCQSVQFPNFGFTFFLFWNLFVEEKGHTFAMLTVYVWGDVIIKSTTRLYSFS